MATMDALPKEDEARIRAEAQKLWEGEGRPKGGADLFLDEARAIVAERDSAESARIPVEKVTDEDVEPELAVEKQGDLPGLTDQGDTPAGPRRDNAREIADELPLDDDEK
ncbi:DUF2934 domain-containing protein [Consotaella salsifontis]|nr:DUF2934 domain-containing protein [Consotaella salsifontis]